MVRPLRRPPPAQTIQVAPIPAPTGGINTISPASAMPATDCIQLYNMVAGEYGLRVRLGSQEWGTSTGGGWEPYIKTILPFTGSAKSGAHDRLFAADARYIYDISDSGELLADSSGDAGMGWAFAEETPDSGYGIVHAHRNSAGAHFLLYCDEQNGYHVYTESTDQWRQIHQTATVDWAASTAYAAGDLVLNNSGKTYLCVGDGTSAASGGPTGTSSGITDGGATWDYQAGTIGGVDPANLAFVTVFGGRVWFVEKDTANAWYLAAGAIYGDAVKFTLGSKFRAGGPLVGVWNWTIGGDGGGNDKLVFISQGGDLTVYEGTDPASATSFRIVGTWYVGGVPNGRRICTNFGGDLLVLCKLGVLPLSRLLGGAATEDTSIYATEKIAPLFNSIMLSKANLRGWALQLHPEDNSLMIVIPNGDGEDADQLVMSLWNRSWSQYRDLPLYSCEVWGGKLYLGTPDGRVMINDGYVDGVTIAAPTSYTAIQFALLTSFQNLGNGRKKQIQSIRPTFLTGGPSSYTAAARYKYDFSELATVSLGTGGEGTWDHSTWDSSVWQAEYTPSQAVTGAVGMGVEMAVALRGAANSRTVLVGLDVFYTQGGLL